MSFYTSVQKINDSIFILKHENNAEEDKRIEVYCEDDNVEYEGLPRDMNFELESTFKLRDR